MGGNATDKWIKLLRRVGHLTFGLMFRHNYADNHVATGCSSDVKTGGDKMKRVDFVLAALSAEGGRFSPVQVQKMFFLLEKNIPSATFKHSFGFKPYNYGPYSCSVYQDLEELSVQGLVAVTQSSSFREFAVTPEGAEQGKVALKELSEPAQLYIRQVSKFVRSLTFPQLVSAIYKAYPDMRKKSVFRE